MEGGSNIAIYGAIGANILIATGKLIGASITGSSAMMAEGIYSLVDTGNGLPLLVKAKACCWAKVPMSKYCLI